MPNVGDELHHFGWNACSSALCPWAPHPHVERRYLLVPGLRSSRLHVFDVKDDPRAPKLVKVIEPEEIGSKAGYSRPHTIHCGPDGIYVSARWRHPRARPRRHLPARPRDLRGEGRVGGGPRTAAARLRLLVAPGHGVVVTSEWGTPKMVEDGLVGELLLGNQYGHHLHVWDLDSAATARRSTSAPSTRWCSSCGRRTIPRSSTGSSAWSSRPPTCRHRSGCGTGDGRIDRGEQGDRDPRRAGRGRPAPRILKPFGAVPPLVTDIDLSVDDATLYVSCWGTGELKRFDVRDPRNPKGDRLGSPRRDRPPRPSTRPPARSTAARRWSRPAATGGACT